MGAITSSFDSIWTVSPARDFFKFENKNKKRGAKFGEYSEQGHGGGVRRYVVMVEKHFFLRQ